MLYSFTSLTVIGNVLPYVPEMSDKEGGLKCFKVDQLDFAIGDDLFFVFFLSVFFLLQPFVLMAHSISTCSHPTETATARPSMFTWIYVMTMTSERRMEEVAGDV